MANNDWQAQSWVSDATLDDDWSYDEAYAAPRHRLMLVIAAVVALGAVGLFMVGGSGGGSQAADTADADAIFGLGRDSIGTLSKSELQATLDLPPGTSSEDVSWSVASSDGTSLAKGSGAQVTFTAPASGTAVLTAAIDNGEGEVTTRTGFIVRSANDFAATDVHVEGTILINGGPAVEGEALENGARVDATEGSISYIARANKAGSKAGRLTLSGTVFTVGREEGVDQVVNTIAVDRPDAGTSELSADVEHLDGEQYVQVRTPDAVAMVKGTTFDVEVSESGSELAVEDGLVGYWDRMRYVVAPVDVGTGDAATVERLESIDPHMEDIAELLTDGILAVTNDGSATPQASVSTDPAAALIRKTSISGGDGGESGAGGDTGDDPTRLLPVLQQLEENTNSPLTNPVENDATGAEGSSGDLCLNISGVQTVIPPNHERTADGRCVLKSDNTGGETPDNTGGDTTLTDICSNYPGSQPDKPRFHDLVGSDCRPKPMIFADMPCRDASPFVDYLAWSGDIGGQRICFWRDHLPTELSVPDSGYFAYQAKQYGTKHFCKLGHVIWSAANTPATNHRWCLNKPTADKPMNDDAKKPGAYVPGSSLPAGLDWVDSSRTYDVYSAAHVAGNTNNRADYGCHPSDNYFSAPLTFGGVTGQKWCAHLH